MLLDGYSRIYNIHFHLFGSHNFTIIHELEDLQTGYMHRNHTVELAGCDLAGIPLESPPTIGTGRLQHSFRWIDHNYVACQLVDGLSEGYHSWAYLINAHSTLVCQFNNGSGWYM